MKSMFKERNKVMNLKVLQNKLLETRRGENLKSFDGHLSTFFLNSYTGKLYKKKISDVSIYTEQFKKK